MSRYGRRRRYAFTLIEVAAVVAIMACLTVGIIGAFRNRREAQYRQACRANILRLASWLEASKVERGLYFNEHGGKEASYANTKKFEEWYKTPCPFYRCPYGNPAYARNNVAENEYTYMFYTTYSAYTIKCTCKHPDGASPQYSSLATNGWVDGASDVSSGVGVGMEENRGDS